MIESSDSNLTGSVSTVAAEAYGNFGSLVSALLSTEGYAVAVVPNDGRVILRNDEWTRLGLPNTIDAAQVSDVLRAESPPLVIPVDDRGAECIPVGDGEHAVIRIRATDVETSAPIRHGQLLLDAAGEGIYGLDLDGRTTFLNQAAAEMIGWSREDLIGKKQHQVLHHSYADGSSYPAEECPIYRTLRDGAARRKSDEVFWKKDGSPFPVEYTTTPIQEQGKIVGAVVVFRDLTEDRKALEKIAASEARYRAMLDALPDTIVRVTRDGVIKEFRLPEGFNPEVEEHANRPVSIDINSMLPSDLAHRLMTAVEQAFVTGDVQQFEYDWEVQSEMRTREARISPTHMGEAVAVVRDITAERRAVNDLAASEKSLRESQAQLQAMMDSALDAVMAFQSVRDASGKIIDFTWTFVNRRAEDWVHRSADDLISRRMLEEMPGNKKEGLYDEYVQVVETGEPMLREFHYDHDGIDAYFAATAVKLGDGFMVSFRDTTEARVREEALRSSERLLARAQSVAGIGSWMWDPQTGDLEFSDELYRIFGLDVGSEVTFDLFISAALPEDREQVIASIQGVLESKEPFAYEERIVRPDNSMRVLSSAGEVLQDEDGYLTVLGVCHDVTESRETERQVRHSEERLQYAQRIARIGSWDWDVESETLILSDEMQRILGVQAQELSFDEFIATVHGEDQGRVRRALEQAIAERADFKFYYTVRQGEGERILRAEGRVNVDESSGRLRVFGTGHDVTEVRRAEDQIRESEQRFRQLAEQMSDLVGVHDAQWRYLYVSPSSKRILGYAPQDLIGTSCFDLVHPDDTGRLQMLSHRDVTKPVETVVRMRHSDGYWCWLEMVATPMKNDADGIGGVQTSARDVTARVEAQQAAARSAATLAQRNRELQDFAYVASHDLQEPLRKIRAFADLLAEEYGGKAGEDAGFYLARIRDSAERMATLISDLLAFSRISTRGKPYVSVDLDVVVSEVVSDLEVLIREVDGTIAYNDLPTITADRTQVRQLLQNLVGNALKFSRPDAPPVVTIDARQTATTMHRGGDEREVIEITVADNGIGFDEKYLDRIFTPFQRLHNRSKYAGTGMGLAICRRIVERHGGSLTARSVPGEGSTFIVQLPIHHST
jgi:PAS domain S-box-containing protein